MKMQFIGANADPLISTSGRSEDYINYYAHDITDVHHYASVTYHDLYPGIDWVVRAEEQGIKHDFIVKSGADPAQIRMHFSDHDSLFIDPAGRLVQRSALGEFVEKSPVSYQEGREIPTSFVLEDDVVRFKVQQYNKAKELVIDPELIWATYYGGENDDAIVSCDTDQDLNVFVAGNTLSFQGIASNGHQNIIASLEDSWGELQPFSCGFLVKFNSAGQRLWSTYYGGVRVFSYTIDIGCDGGTVDTIHDVLSGTEISDCTVDAEGNVFICGTTQAWTGIATGSPGLPMWQEMHPQEPLWMSYFSDPVADELFVIPPSGMLGSFSSFLAKFNTQGIRQWGTYYSGGALDSYGQTRG
ncbi:MAG TPA: hypothetical protein PKJ19_14750 [Flavobacteriales bacterium]|nr:hypothetical protein [Flavobacteriales bacterium]